MVCLLSDNLPRTRKLFTYDDDAKPEAPDNTVVANRSHNKQHIAKAASNKPRQTRKQHKVRKRRVATPARTRASATLQKRGRLRGRKAKHPATRPTKHRVLQAGEQAQLPNHPAAAQPEQPQANPDQQVRDWLRTEHGLTAREIDVALLIAHGRSKTFIANELFISENTVRTHSKNVYAKLGIHSREELISLFENRLNA